MIDEEDKDLKEKREKELMKMHDEITQRLKKAEKAKDKKTPLAIDGHLKKFKIITDFRNKNTPNVFAVAVAKKMKLDKIKELRGKIAMMPHS